MIKFFKDAKNMTFFPWFMLFVSALLYTFGIQAFLQVAHTFSSGMGAIAALPTFISADLKQYFSVLYFAINVPLILYFWRKNKRTFMLKSLFFLIVQTAIGSLFLINEVHDLFANMIIDSSKVWDLKWPIFVLSSLGGMFVGISIGVAYKYGGSTGGTDLIIYYYSTKKKQSIGGIMMVVSIGFAILALVTTVIVDKDVRNNWLSITVSTATYIIVTFFLLNIIYPRYSKVRVEIHSEKMDEIIAYMSDTKNYIHSFQILEVTSGFTKEKKKIVMTMMLLLEFKNFLVVIREIDPNVWISATEVRRQVGKFNTSSVE